MTGMFQGPMWTDAQELAMHAPPALVWFDDAGQLRRRCVTDEPNPHCNGCRETGMPSGDYWRWEPPQ